MKKLLPLFGAAIFMVACNQTPEQVAGTSTSPYIQQQAQQQQSVADTAGLASYNAWKAQNELADLNDYQAKQTVAAPVRKAATAKAPVRKAAASRPVTQSSSPAETTASTGSGSGTTAGAGNESSETAPAEKKEGWSKAAKGAVIGGVAGAAGGAVINKKNRVVGAVVGAVIGAGGGYVIGRQQDKKDGRIQIQ